MRPDISISIGDDLDPALAGVADEYDDRALTTTFGYEPRWSLERGLQATLEGYGRMVADGPAAVR